MYVTLDVFLYDSTGRSSANIADGILGQGTTFIDRDWQVAAPQISGYSAHDVDLKEEAQNIHRKHSSKKRIARQVETHLQRNGF